MRKIAMAILLVMLMATATAWTASVDVNGFKASQTDTASDTTEDGVMCTADDGNFQITVVDANVGAGLFVAFNGSRSSTIGFEDDNGCGIVGSAAADWNAHANATGEAYITVAAPTSEGYYYLCVVDTNGYIRGGSVAAADNKDCEWVGVKPDSTYTKYTLTNSDGNGFCKTTDYSTFEGKIEDIVGYGKIETTQGSTMDLSGDIDFDSTTNFNNANKLTVEGISAIQGRTIKVTFKKPSIPSGQFEIRRNDSGCGSCSAIGSNSGQVHFTVTNFSTYEVKDMPAGAAPSAGAAIYAVSQIPSLDTVAESVGGTQNLVIGIIVAIAVVIIAVKLKK